MGIAFAVILIIALVVYLYEKGKKQFTVTGGVTAFAKIADAEGKILAAKAKAELQKDAAIAVHKTLDEVHDILG